MPWKPATDFEEEIVNLQPDHDFIFGALSEPEPQPFYPRPQSHIDYAAMKKKQLKKQQEEYEKTGKINNRLHAIAEIQSIAGTKPLGEQPTLDDWSNNKNTEKEIVAMMRHFGLGPSVEEPLNENLTIATYPISNGVEIVKNKCKKIPLLFDDNLFKLKPKESPTNSSSNTSSNSYDSACGENKNGDLNTSSSSSSFSSISCATKSSSSFLTPSSGDDSLDISLSDYQKAQPQRCSVLVKQEENTMFEYSKLKEENEEEDITKNNDNDSSFCTATTSCDETGGYETATTTCSSSSHTLNPNALEYVPSKACNIYVTVSNNRMMNGNVENSSNTPRYVSSSYNSNNNGEHFYNPRNTPPRLVNSMSSENSYNGSTHFENSHNTYHRHINPMSSENSYNDSTHFDNSRNTSPRYANSTTSENSYNSRMINGNYENACNISYRYVNPSSCGNYKNRSMTNKQLENPYSASMCVNSSSDEDILTEQAPSFLQRFLEQPPANDSQKQDKNPASSSQFPPTYANIAKHSLAIQQKQQNHQTKTQQSPSLVQPNHIFNFPPLPKQTPLSPQPPSSSRQQTTSNLRFYTARELYERKRGVHAMN
ncbi:squash [Musca autumnalis]|uniref:squash n=1 Tax=Musca autumnalis TaxID=221902 RepID=UPI003CFA6555